MSPTLPPTLPAAGQATAKRALWRPRLSSFRVLWPVLALGLLLAFDGRYSPGFFHVGTRDGRLFGTPVDVLHYAAPIVLLGLGMTLVIATGGVDLSVGATMAISANVLCLWVRGPAQQYTGSVAVGVILGLAAAAACGAWNGLLVAGFGIQPIIATLILMIGGRGIAELITDNQAVTLPQYVLGAMHYLGGDPSSAVGRAIHAVPLDVVWAVLAVVVVAVLVRRTALGLFLESVGNNPTASRYAGVNAGGVTFGAYVVCGLTAGLAGMFLAADLDSASVGLGTARELDAILAVSLGGTALAGGRFSLAGTVVGAVIIAVLQKTILQVHIGGRPIRNEWFPVVKAVVILAVCLIQSDVLRARVTGLFRRRKPPSPRLAAA